MSFFRLTGMAADYQFFVLWASWLQFPLQHDLFVSFNKWYPVLNCIAYLSDSDSLLTLLCMRVLYF